MQVSFLIFYGIIISMTLQTRRSLALYILLLHRLKSEKWKVKMTSEFLFCVKTFFCLMITCMAFFFSVVGLMIIHSDDLNMKNGIWISISMPIFTIGLFASCRLCLLKCKEDGACCFINESNQSLQNDLQVQYQAVFF